MDSLEPPFLFHFGVLMPVASPDQYAQMLDTAKAKGFAFPAINVSSSSTVNAVLQGLTEAGSDALRLAQFSPTFRYQAGQALEPITFTLTSTVADGRG